MKRAIGVPARVDHLIRNAKFTELLDPELAQQWELNRNVLRKFTETIGVTGDTFHTCVTFIPKYTHSVEATLLDIQSKIPNEENWAFLTGTAPAQQKFVMAYPLTSTIGKITEEKVLKGLFVDIHSTMVAWWLCSAWRSLQLSDASWHLVDQQQIIPAAASARSLLETAASLWVEATRIRDIWADTKEACRHGPLHLKLWQDMSKQLITFLLGAKFDNFSEDLQKAFGSIQRVNVLTLVQKLAKASNRQAYDDYQWLCNAVHPSVGNLLAFTGPAFMHSTDTVIRRHYSPLPIRAENVREEVSNRHVGNLHDALARSMCFAISVATELLDQSLRVVDDVALTTGAPGMADFQYWRQLNPGPRNAACRCRSGRKGKNCVHDWMSPAPEISRNFQ